MNSTDVILENTAKLKLVSKRTSFYHFLLLCFDIQIGENTLASKRSIRFFEALAIYFSGMMTASIMSMTRTIDGHLILNKLGRRRGKLC